MADKDIDDQVLAAIKVARNVGADPIADFSRPHRIRRPSRRLDDQPETTAVELTNVSAFYRAEFFKFMVQMCTTLMEKQIGLKDTFNPFLKVLHPETPGTRDGSSMIWWGGGGGGGGGAQPALVPSCVSHV
jgi:hypothetical protein